MRPLQPGEELTIAYTDLLQTLDERQQSLLERYAFDCCCARCKDESPSPGDWFLDAIAAEGQLHASFWTLPYPQHVSYNMYHQLALQWCHCSMVCLSCCSGLV